MSLTSLLDFDEDIITFFKSIIAKKNDFMTISGKKAFSQEYIEVVPCKLENSYNAGLLGTAFDYAARIVIARTVKQNRKNACKGLIAELALSRCKITAEKQDIDIYSIFSKNVNQFEMYISGADNYNDMLCSAVLFAKLEHIYRRRLMPWQINLTDVENIPEDIVTELDALLKVFVEKIIESAHITEDSVVVYNPHFGGASFICDGADADIYIDGTLYDFKCTKNKGYNWIDIAQITGYLLLHNLAESYDDETNDLHGLTIEKVAIYHSRFGEVEYIDVNQDQAKLHSKQFEMLIGENLYKEYFEKLAEEKRQEELRQIEFNTLYRIWEIKFNTLTRFVPYVQKEENPENKQKYLTKMQSSFYAWYHQKIDKKVNGLMIKKLMDDKNISIKELSERMRKSTTAIRSWINQKSNPELGSYIELSAILECPIEMLFRK